jgi:hypothetical protein
MSKEEIPWNRVAQEIIKTMGVETARGLYYALIGQSLYPALSRLIQAVASGGAKSDESLRAALEEIRKLQQQQQVALSPQAPSDPQQLAMALAQMLQRSYPQLQQSGLPPTPAYQPPIPQVYPQPRPSPELEERVRSLEREIETLEGAKQELMRKYYTTFNEEERKQIEQRLTEIDKVLNERKTNLLVLRSQIPAYR